MQRLMGLEPNEHEVKKFGVMDPKALALLQKRQNMPNWELIDDSGPMGEPRK